MLKKARKLHITLGIIFSIPLLLSAITGMGYAIFDEILEKEDIGEFFIRLHTMKMFGLEKVYPVILGISLIGLASTGLYMAFKIHTTKRKNQPKH